MEHILALFAFFTLMSKAFFFFFLRNTSHYLKGRLNFSFVVVEQQRLLFQFFPKTPFLNLPVEVALIFVIF